MRHYHTRQHLDECLTQFHDYRGLAKRPEEIEIAIWFHDAIYDTYRSDNEKKSALWAGEYLASAGVNRNTVKRVTNMILATKTHETNDPDSALMVGINLAILDAPPNVFERYDRAIRLEYAWVPEAAIPFGSHTGTGGLSRASIHIRYTGHPSSV
jgi:predicted metal-dependent HD superfamily phosphohydrolase